MKIYVNKGNYGWQTRAVNGEDKMYIDVQFKKGEEPQETFCQIELIDAFFSMYRNNQNYPKPKLVIMKYQKTSKKEYKQEEIYKTDDSDLPF